MYVAGWLALFLSFSLSIKWNYFDEFNPLAYYRWILALIEWSNVKSAREKGSITYNDENQNANIFFFFHATKVKYKHKKI